MSAKEDAKLSEMWLDDLRARMRVAEADFASRQDRPLLTPAERVARFDAIRSSFKGVAEDTTPLIRRDRDER